MNNINYGDKSLITKYLQYFLRDNYSNIIKMSWNYDEYTHQKLLEYLDTPNYITANNLLDYLVNNIKFSEILYSGYDKLEYPLKFMQHHMEENTIVFFAKNPMTIEGYNEGNYPTGVSPYKLFKALIPVLSSVHNDIEEYCTVNGWRIAEYPSTYKEIETVTEDVINELESITIVLKTKTPTNIFPHFDLRYMVNYFNNDYVNNYDISNNIFRKSSNYRVALINCEPGDNFIISHGYSYSIPIKVGYTPEKLNDVIDILYTAKNITALKVQGMDINNTNKLLPGIPMMVTVPHSTDNNKQYKTLIIVTPKLKYSKTIDTQTQTPLSYTDVYFKLGDISNDGVIDEIDRLIYACQKPEDFGIDGIFYFNYDYDRFDKLCECIEQKYEHMFLCNGENKKYNNFILSKGIDNNGNTVYNIDNVIRHLEFLCSGTDIKFKRYLINGGINYRIILGNTVSKINVDLLKSNSITISDYDVYLSNLNTDNQILDYYVYETDGGYEISNNPNSVGIDIICNNNMTSNNLLVIKSNKYDELEKEDEPCYSIINGSHSTEKNLSLPISDFKNNPWMVREEFISAIMDYITNPYSNQEDIAYLQRLIYSTDSKIFGEYQYIYSDSLREFVKKLQIKINSPFSLGYANGLVYDTLFSDAYNNYINDIVGG